ncbi:MAG: hypothetical protein Q7J54_02340 [Candidatus Woesearchaeota archaeon]|nr:hypothetical protein [Candidatus Woesearchaeota archaeon]
MNCLIGNQCNSDIFFARHIFYIKDLPLTAATIGAPAFTDASTTYIMQMHIFEIKLRTDKTSPL